MTRTNNFYQVLSDKLVGYLFEGENSSFPHAIKADGRALILRFSNQRAQLHNGTGVANE